MSSVDDAQMYCAAGKHDAALDMARELATSYPANADTHALHALLLAAREPCQKVADEMVGALISTLRCDPGACDALHGLLALNEGMHVPCAQFVEGLALFLDACEDNHAQNTGGPVDKADLAAAHDAELKAWVAFGTALGACADDAMSSHNLLREATPGPDSPSRSSLHSTSSKAGSSLDGDSIDNSQASEALSPHSSKAISEAQSSGPDGQRVQGGVDQPSARAQPGSSGPQGKEDTSCGVGNVANAISGAVRSGAAEEEFPKPAGDLQEILSGNDAARSAGPQPEGAGLSTARADTELPAPSVIGMAWREWEALQPILQECAAWWGPHHFNTLTLLPYSDSPIAAHTAWDLLAAKAIAAAFVLGPYNAFTEQVVSIAGDTLTGGALALTDLKAAVAVAKKVRLAWGKEVVRCPPLSHKTFGAPSPEFGTLRNMPASWWDAFPVVRRKQRACSDLLHG